MREFSKVQGCKINVQKPIDFIYTNNNLLEDRRVKDLIQSTNKKEKIPSNKFNKKCTSYICTNL